MRRILALALAVNQVPGGILLIDEVDTGLHYSVMGDLWRSLVEAARQFDIQVFATTHSLDCINGLSWLHRNRPDLAEDVSLQSLDRRLDKAVAYEPDQIQVAVEQQIEVRG